MHVISYISNSCIAPSEQKPAVADLVRRAQRRNDELKVTGVLFFENNHFFQTIEGPEDRLRKLYGDIERDQRHHNIVKLVDEPISQRAFGDWSLDAFFLDNPELLNPVSLELLRKLYIQNFGFETSNMIEFIKTVIDEMDTFKIKLSV